MTDFANALALSETMFDTLRRNADDPPGVTRAAFSAGEDAAHALAADVSRDMGLTVEHDIAGNQYMVWPGADRTRPRIMVGSHMDTVAHGGNFDGAAGVVMGLAAIRALKDRGVMPARDLAVMAIRAEELVWFPTPYCGSRMAFGLLPTAEYEAVKRSDTGRSLADHMREGGWNPDALAAGARPLDPARIAAFIESHIEQGPVLDRAGEAVGIVTGIRGNLRYRHARIDGTWDHAGAVPREYRHDAVRAGAAFVTALEAMWDAYDAAGEDFVATIGEFFTDPTMHGMTKIPGLVRFTMDLRSLDADLLHRTDERLRELAEEISARYRVAIEIGTPTHAKPALMDPALVESLAGAAAARGIAHRRMASGAGHDCATFATQGVPSAMLFVRNQNGSHNPHEAMRMDDFAAGIRVLTDALEALVTQ